MTDKEEIKNYLGAEIASMKKFITLEMNHLNEHLSEIKKDQKELFESRNSNTLEIRLLKQKQGDLAERVKENEKNIKSQRGMTYVWSGLGALITAMIVGMLNLGKLAK